jgi:hypothetical protein
MQMAGIRSLVDTNTETLTPDFMKFKVLHGFKAAEFPVPLELGYRGFVYLRGHKIRDIHLNLTKFKVLDSGKAAGFHVPPESGYR